MSTHNEMLESIYEMDEAQLEREIGFAELSTAKDFPETHQWLSMLREELAERQEKREAK